MAARERGSMVAIGALSRATGVPVDTIRTWERRYGRPAAVRLPSGHRRYDLATIEWLSKVKVAIDCGLKPSVVVPAEGEALDALLSAGSPISETVVGIDRQRFADPIEEWLNATKQFDGASLERLLFRTWSTHGAIVFLDHCAEFIQRVGSEWADGDLNVGQEHFASAHLSRFLRQRASEIPGDERGPIVVCATLAGETHGLGIDMAAIAMAVGGARVRNLGTDVPVADLVASAGQLGARIVALSVSSSAAAEMSTERLRELRVHLPEQTVIWVGGDGRFDATAGVVSVRSFGAAKRLAAGLVGV